MTRTTRPRPSRTRSLIVAVAFAAILATLARPSATNAAELGNAAPAPAPARENAPAIVDVPVAFTVTNTNRSAVRCHTDGKQYTIRGHMTGPASALDSPQLPSGALYLHGLEVGEDFWRTPIVGDGFVRDLATRGHVSVTIDRLGYNTSGAPNGFNICVGGHADIAHQIIGQLRAGTYDGELHPKFGNVALLGHSLGGAITEIEAYSFRDVDAIGVLSFADAALTPSVLLGSRGWGLGCLTGGTRSEAGAPGYAYLTTTLTDYQRNFLAHTPPAVLPQAIALRELNPCTDMLSAVLAVPVSLLNLSRIKIPVLVMTGTQDLVFDVNRVRLQASLFTGSHALTVRVVPGATHGFTLEPTVTEFVAGVDAWLHQHGF
jgi:pimeloyl-ACP methyl ester carboxylesterase